MQKRWVNRVRKGEAKSSYGTGALNLVDTSKEVINLNYGLLFDHFAFMLRNNASTKYALEVSISIAGAAVLWLMDIRCYKIFLSYGGVMILCAVLFK